MNASLHIGLAGWAGWDLPIQELCRYRAAPYDWRIWEFVIIQLLTNWLGAVVFGLFIIYLSARSSSYLSVFFIAGIIFVLSFFIRNISDLSVPWLLKNLTMVDVMRVENLFNRSRFVYIGEWSLQLPFILFYAYMLMLAVFFAAGVFQRFKSPEIT